MKKAEKYKILQTCTIGETLLNTGEEVFITIRHSYFRTENKKKVTKSDIIIFEKGSTKGYWIYDIVLRPEFIVQI